MWDGSLIGPINLIAKPSLLEDKNVIKMFPIKTGKLPNVDVKNFIFITRPNIQIMNTIAAYIHSDAKKMRVY